MERLVETAIATATAHDMICGASPVVAMVSGGADSTALLRVLASGALAAGPLSVLHVDHGLRGAESDADARFVSGMCEELGVPCRVVVYDVASYAESEGLNLEDAGRRVRYRFAEEELDARCAHAGVPASAGRIATAHTLDDRIETLVMRVVQGAGGRGLVSPPYVRGRVIRPLLDCTRAEVVSYLGSLGQGWREDATNADTSRLRARIRSEVVPLLRAIEPRLDRTLSRTIAVLADEDELLTEMASGFLAEFADFRSGDVALDRARMRTLSRPMMRRVVRMALMGAFPEASRIEFDHVEALCDGMGPAAFARDLPGGLRAFTEYDTLVISREPGPLPSLAPSLLNIPGTIELPGAGRMAAEEASAGAISDDPRSAVVDADRIRGPLTVDSVRPGDRMRPLGMDGSRKLQDVLTDAKIPRRARSQVPVVRDGDRVVWVAGVRMSDEYRVGPSTRRAVRLTYDV